MLDQGSHPLAHAIDKICAHGIPRVDEQMDHQHFAGQGTQRVGVDFDIHGATTSRHHAGVKAVREVENVLFMFQHCRPGPGQVGHFQHLDLPDEHGRGRA